VIAFMRSGRLNRIVAIGPSTPYSMSIMPLARWSLVGGRCRRSVVGGRWLLVVCRRPSIEIVRRRALRF
jgi:hypothetical protein